MQKTEKSTQSLRVHLSGWGDICKGWPRSTFQILLAISPLQRSAARAKFSKIRLQTSKHKYLFIPYRFTKFPIRKQRNKGSTILRHCVLHDYPDICWCTKPSFAFSCWNTGKGASTIISHPSPPDLKGKIKGLLIAMCVFFFSYSLPIFLWNLLCLICFAVFLHKVLSKVPPIPNCLESLISLG